MLTFPQKTTLASACAALILGTTAPAYATSDTDGDGIPDSAEALMHTDPQQPDTDGDGVNDLQDDNAAFAPTPLPHTGQPAPFRIGEALVENNYDPVARQDVSDHLELQVLNSSNTALTDFTVYYTIKDGDNGATEAYRKQLSGFTVPAHGEARLHFDDGTQPQHFRANPNSIYVTSSAAKTFTVTLQASGFQPVTVSLDKDAGGAEVAD